MTENPLIIKDWWNEIRALDDLILKTLQEDTLWDQLDILIKKRAGMLSVWGDLIQRKHLPPLTEEQRKALQYNHRKLLLLTQKTHQKMKQQMHVSSQYTQLDQKAQNRQKYDV